MIDANSLTNSAFRFKLQEEKYKLINDKTAANKLIYSNIDSLIKDQKEKSMMLTNSYNNTLNKQIILNNSSYKNIKEKNNSILESNNKINCKSKITNTNDSVEITNKKDSSKNIQINNINNKTVVSPLTNNTEKNFNKTNDINNYNDENNNLYYYNNNNNNNNNNDFDTKNNINELNNISHIDFSNKTIKLLTSRYKKEIKDLKAYIIRINNELRNSNNLHLSKNIVNLDIFIRNRAMECISKNKTNNLLSDMKNTTFTEIYMFFTEEIIELINEYLNTVLVDVNITNPIFDSYEDLIKSLNSQLKELKDQNNKLISNISDLINENKNIREDNLYYKTELQNILKSKLVSNKDENDLESLNNAIVSGNINYDKEFISTLEERCNLLSRENEILTVNFQKITKEFCDFKNEVIMKYQKSLEYVNNYDVLKNDNDFKTNLINELNSKITINENKLFSFIEENNLLNNTKDELLIKVQRLINDNNLLKDSNEFYKNQLISNGILVSDSINTTTINNDVL